MNINLQSLKFKASGQLKEFVDEKVNKLLRFDEKIISADVTLILDSANIPENKICEIKLVVPGNDDFVSKSATTFEEAIQDCVGTLQNILQRKKTRA
jgi:ribosomal subunit interface protein